MTPKPISQDHIARMRLDRPGAYAYPNDRILATIDGRDLLIRKLIHHGNGNIVGFTDEDHRLMREIDLP